MFPVSLPKGRFPSGLPSLKLSLGFPSMVTCCSGAAHALSWGIYDPSKALMGMTWVPMSQGSCLYGAPACLTQLLGGTS